MQKRIILIVGAVAAITAGVYVWKAQTSVGVSPVGPETPVAAPVNEEDAETKHECSIDATAMKGAIDINHPDIAKVEKNGREGQSFVQIIAFKDGSKIEYSEGGCEHFGFNFILTPYPVSPNKIDWLADAEKLLARPIYNENGITRVRTFQEALANPDLREEESEDTVGLPCGDAHCTLIVREEKLELSYSFAL